MSELLKKKKTRWHEKTLELEAEIEMVKCLQ